VRIPPSPCRPLSTAAAPPTPILSQGLQASMAPSHPACAKCIFRRIPAAHRRIHAASHTTPAVDSYSLRPLVPEAPVKTPYAWLMGSPPCGRSRGALRVHRRGKSHPSLMRIGKRGICATGGCFDCRAPTSRVRFLLRWAAMRTSPSAVILMCRRLRCCHFCSLLL
jgi:hypothetical protein